MSLKQRVLEAAKGELPEGFYLSSTYNTIYTKDESMVLSVDPKFPEDHIVWKLAGMVLNLPEESVKPSDEFKKELGKCFGITD